MKRAFSLVELMIVVAVLGILAAIVVPQFQSHSTQARESAAKSNLRILRSAVELYATQHNDIPPGYPNGNVTAQPSEQTLTEQLFWSSNRSGQTSQQPAAGFELGPYIRSFPVNSFNGLSTVKIIGNSEALPANATGDFGYIYKPAIKTIRLDWAGADKDGILYYNY